MYVSQKISQENLQVSKSISSIVFSGSVSYLLHCPMRPVSLLMKMLILINSFYPTPEVAEARTRNQAVTIQLKYTDLEWQHQCWVLNGSYGRSNLWTSDLSLRTISSNLYNVFKTLIETTTYSFIWYLRFRFILIFCVCFYLSVCFLVFLSVYI